MATQVEAERQVCGRARQRAGHGDSLAPALLTALVEALEGALLAARRLLDAPALAAGHHAVRVAEHRAVGGSGRAGAACDGLSRREAEVLRLLAAGRSNRRIAQALFLSPRTIQRHVANIYLKIGVHCRAEATAFALDHDLR